MRNAIRLSFQLFSRTFKAKFRKSFLGYFWIVIPAALITVGVWTASRAGVLDPGGTALPYPLFAFIGTMVWQVFAEGVEVPHQAIEGARSYLTRVMFPREAIVLAQLYESLINTGVRLIAVFMVMSFAGHISLAAVSLVMACFAVTLLLAVGLGGLLAPFMLLFADAHNSFKLFLTYGLFLSPALYMPQRGGIFATLVEWNPVSPLMKAARDAAEHGVYSEPATMAVITVAAVLLLLVGLWIVRRSVPIVVERMLLGGR